jgi:hypothetical protein
VRNVDHDRVQPVESVFERLHRRRVDIQLVDLVLDFFWSPWRGDVVSFGVCGYIKEALPEMFHGLTHPPRLTRVKMRDGA